MRSRVALKNRRTSETDYPILDSETWDYKKIWINLIRIKLFEQLGLENLSDPYK